MERLLLLREEAAYDLASSALFGGVPGDPLRALAALAGGGESLRAKAAHAEATQIALLRAAGASWDVLASHTGVSKQALHRRVYRAVDDILIGNRDPAITAEFFDWYVRDSLDRNRDYVTTWNIETKEERELERAELAEVWQQIAQTPAWTTHLSEE